MYQWVSTLCRLWVSHLLLYQDNDNVKAVSRAENYGGMGLEKGCVGDWKSLHFIPQKEWPSWLHNNFIMSHPVRAPGL